MVLGPLQLEVCRDHLYVLLAVLQGIPGKTFKEKLGIFFGRIPEAGRYTHLKLSRMLQVQGSKYPSRRECPRKVITNFMQKYAPFGGALILSVRGPRIEEFLFQETAHRCKTKAKGHQGRESTLTLRAVKQALVL